MAKVFVQYRLRPGVDEHVYGEWSKSQDQPVMRRASSVRDLHLYRVVATRQTNEGTRYIEVLDVSSREEFEADLQTPAVKATSAEWAEQVMDDVSLVYAEEVL